MYHFIEKLKGNPEADTIDVYGAMDMWNKSQEGKNNRRNKVIYSGIYDDEEREDKKKIKGDLK